MSIASRLWWIAVRGMLSLVCGLIALTEPQPLQEARTFCTRRNGAASWE